MERFSPVREMENAPEAALIHIPADD